MNSFPPAWNVDLLTYS